MYPLLALIAFGLPSGSQLPLSQNSMSPQESPPSKRRTTAPEATFSQIRPANDSLELLGRSKSPCFGRSSQSRPRSLLLLQHRHHHQSIVSENDSQLMDDDKEEREERKRRRREDEAYWIASEPEDSQRSGQQKEGKEPASSKPTTKPPKPSVV